MQRPHIINLVFEKQGRVRPGSDALGFSTSAQAAPPLEVYR
jgi:hypothetical protein